MLGDQRPGDRGAQEIFALVERVGAEHGEHELAHELLAQILDEDVLLLDAHLQRLVARRLDFLALADVGGEGDHFAAVLVLQPLEDHRGVEAPGIGEHHLADLAFHFTLPRSRNSSSAFCVCRRFSASSHTTLCGPSITSAATSSPRCAGRQCMKSASFFAARIISASTCQSWKSRFLSASSDSKPIEVHTPVVTRSGPRAASTG